MRLSCGAEDEDDFGDGGLRRLERAFVPLVAAREMAAGAVAGWWAAAEGANGGIGGADAFG